MVMAGYSNTPLPKKLGIQPGATVVVLNAPLNFREILGRIPEGVRFAEKVRQGSDFIHLFTTRRSELAKRIKMLRSKMADQGILWISWPKKSAGVPTDVTEDVIRAVALPLGLVDTKVCAVDEVWSGLKLMIRRENRKPAAKR